MDSFSEREKSSSESEGLNPLERQYYKEQSFWSRLKLQLKGKDRRLNSLGYKIVKPNRKQYPCRLVPSTNKIDNTKYTWYNFIVLFLYFEFSQFSNLNYLLLCISQFFPALKVGRLTRLHGIVHSTVSHNPLFTIFGGSSAAL